MLFRTAANNRAYHLGPFPLETLPRDPSVTAREAGRPPPDFPPEETDRDDRGALAAIAVRYRDLFQMFRDGEVADSRAPVPDDPARRAVDIKGGAYFIDAAQVGICEVPPSAWAPARLRAGHGHAVVLMVEHGRVPEFGNPSHGWIAPATVAIAEMRAAEIAVCVARYIRLLGFPALAHGRNTTDCDIDRLAVLAGLCSRRGDQLFNPYLDRRFSLAAVTTGYRLATDTPLSDTVGDPRGVRYWLGQNGAESGRERARRARRPSHASRYPMEQVKRVDRPTTLILDDEVPRVPKRAAFFERALKGDLGPKAQKERTRFALKHPFSGAMVGPIRAMVPLQDGPVETAPDPNDCDPDANARAIKSLSYHLGADLTGICEIPDYTWFSHREDGTPIAPYHRTAVVMLIDQGFDTMEGASGDDWISGAQSMRGYMRGAEIAGVMAEFLRGRGHPARAQTNIDSDVLQLPLVLWAGLGELSRIGELVLNPFVGPRFKSVVLTTDMPLTPDRPIDFGLQYFCSMCRKCARECPCDAIPWGDKIMFNGYEIWKPDVERCARYRLTNAKGSACGRCMKTCPLNKVVSADGPLAHRIGTWLGINAMWLKPALVPIATRLDDILGYGTRNLVKRWWLDLEIVDGVCVVPRGTNERDLDLAHKIDPAKQKMAVYPASAMPPADHDGPFLVDRKAALAALADMESPDHARMRKARGGA